MLSISGYFIRSNPLRKKILKFKLNCCIGAGILIKFDNLSWYNE